MISMNSNHQKLIFYLKYLRFKNVSDNFIGMSSRQSFFKQYAKSGYIEKINPEFEGIARKYYDQKKVHAKAHEKKVKLDKQVAFVQRVQRKLEQALQKKQDQLKFAKQVSSRFQNDLRRREWIHEYKQKQLQLNKKKATMIKSVSTTRLKDAKQSLIHQKRSLADLNRQENIQLKQAKSLSKAKQEDINRSRVSEIQQYKKFVKDRCNKFYQSQTGSSLNNYNERIQSYKQFKQTDEKQIMTLQERLKQKTRITQQKKRKADELAKQIARVRQQSKLESGLIRSHLRSRSSMSSKSIRSNLGNTDKSATSIKKENLVPVGHD